MKNRAADEVRFFSRPAASGDLIVASNVEGLGGNLPCGVYRPASGYEFVTPAKATLDGVPYELEGYTLETWNGTEWGAQVRSDGALAVGTCRFFRRSQRGQGLFRQHEER